MSVYDVALRDIVFTEISRGGSIYTMESGRGLRAERASLPGTSRSNVRVSRKQKRIILWANEKRTK